jgi:hypothetical protein
LSDILIGHTGFVGSNIAALRTFDAMFNSTSIREIRGQAFNDIVCAGTPGAKWLANQDPERDRFAIYNLRGRLETVAARHFTLISTVDVYGDPVGVDETTDPTPNCPYGVHRLGLEQFVQRHFPSHTIIRLPALFGPGLKKNALFDLMSGRPAMSGLYQWYPVEMLAGDIGKMRGKGVVNFTSPPISMSAVRDTFFPSGTLTPGTANYDVHSVHGHRLAEDDVWQEIGAFLCA